MTISAGSVNRTRKLGWGSTNLWYVAGTCWNERNIDFLPVDF